MAPCKVTAETRDPDTMELKNVEASHVVYCRREGSTAVIVDRDGCEYFLTGVESLFMFPEEAK